MDFKLNWIFKIQFVVVVSHGAKHSTLDLFFFFLWWKTEHRWYFGLKCFPQSSEGLESLSSRMEGVFIRGRRGESQPGLPGLGSCLEASFLSPPSTAPVGMVNCMFCSKERGPPPVNTEGCRHLHNPPVHLWQTFLACESIKVLPSLQIIFT